MDTVKDISVNELIDLLMDARDRDISFGNILIKVNDKTLTLPFNLYDPFVE